MTRDATHGERSFSTIRMAVVCLRDHVAGWPLDDTTRAVVTEELALTFVIARPGGAPSGGFGLIVGRFVIRDDDLAVLDAIKSALVAAAPTNFFLDEPTTASITGPSRPSGCCSAGSSARDVGSIPSR